VMPVTEMSLRLRYQGDERWRKPGSTGLRNDGG
jgi:hypothetical protein